MPQRVNRLPAFVKTELPEIFLHDLLYCLTCPSPALTNKQGIIIADSFALLLFPA